MEIVTEIIAQDRMENQFIPYELAVKLKELGFDEECFGDYELMPTGIDSSDILLNMDTPCSNPLMILCKAPLWQQAFDWFRLEKNLYADIYRTGKLFSANIEDMLMGNSLCEVCNEINYEEARQACLEKLIELYGREIKI